jgi:tripartite-type tricarboxylate transporter receptor subunit TctC
VAGNVLFMLADTASGKGFVASGRLRALGVSSARRLPELAELPTLAEQNVPNYEAYAWQGLVVPVATSEARVQQLNEQLVAALQSNEVKARLAALGVEGLPGSPQDMARYVSEERQRWGQVIQRNNIRID